MDWWIIGAAIAGVVAVVLGVKWVQAVKVLREIGEAFTKTADAMEDKNLTKQEAVELLKEWLDVVSAIRTLVRK